MPKSQLMIPDRIKVGFQSRDDTYSGRLAYVIYFDQKGKLRKQDSWESWRHKDLEPVEYPNEPTEGFVLNKGVGGVKHSYGWNTRSEYIRVYDPRGFEFEISVSNLLFILKECDCSRGKGLDGKFAYAWDGTSLVLLPAISEDYKSSRSFTDLQTQKVKARDLVVGASYLTKQQKTLTYVGRFLYHEPVDNPNLPGAVRKYVFHGAGGYEYHDTPKNIAQLSSDAPSPDLAELIDGYNRGPFGSKPARLCTERIKGKSDYSQRSHWFVPDDAGGYDGYNTVYAFLGYNSTEPKKVEHITRFANYCIIGDSLVRSGRDGTAYPGNRTPPQDRYRYSFGHRHEVAVVPWIEPTEDRLFVELESGSRFWVIGTSYNSSTDYYEVE